MVIVKNAVIYKIYSERAPSLTTNYCGIVDIFIRLTERRERRWEMLATISRKILATRTHFLQTTSAI